MPVQSPLPRSGPHDGPQEQNAAQVACEVSILEVKKCAGILRRFSTSIRQ
jgi:hypothetical protein